MKELEKQRLFWIRRVQSSCDVEDDRLRLNLQPNAFGILECRGRIQGRYPVYLPDASLSTTKLVEDSHLHTLQWGVGMTMAHVRENYWIPKLRQLVRKVIKKCYSCRKLYSNHPPECFHSREQLETTHSKQSECISPRNAEVQEKQ
jgi:hypothetical protein